MQKICIKNFMALKEVEIELQNLVLILGEQASGKSTISKVIYFFKSFRQYLVHVSGLNTSLDHNDLWNEFVKHIQQKFHNFFGSTIRLSNFEITWFFSDDKSFQLSLDKDKRLVIEIKGKSELFSHTLMKLIGDVKQFSRPDGGYQLAMFDASIEELDRFLNEWFEDNRGSVFIPAGRLSAAAYYELLTKSIFDLGRDPLILTGDVYLFSEFLQHSEQLKNRFQGADFESLVADRAARNILMFNRPFIELAQKKIKEILKGTYKQDSSGEKIFLGKDNYVLINQASSGQQEVIRLLQDIFLILLENQKTCRIIEEPEAHLYPMAQKFLIELMVLMINSNNSQVILTTHSPYILSIVNNSLFARRVANKSQTVIAEIQDIIPESCWLDPDKCVVYFLENGRCQSIINPQTGLIAQNFLDEISEKLGDEFDELYQIHARSFR